MFLGKKVDRVFDCFFLFCYEGQALPCNTVNVLEPAVFVVEHSFLFSLVLLVVQYSLYALRNLTFSLKLCLFNFSYCCETPGLLLFSYYLRLPVYINRYIFFHLFYVHMVAFGNGDELL